MTNYKQLWQILDHIQRCGSLSETSQKLYLSQPYISRILNTWENRFQTVLVDRKHRPLTLTDHGQICLYHLNEIMLQYAQMEEEMALNSTIVLPRICIYLANPYLKEEVLQWYCQNASMYKGSICFETCINQPVSQLFERDKLHIMIGKQFQVDGTNSLPIGIRNFCLAGMIHNKKIPDFQSCMMQAGSTALVLCGDTFFLELIRELFRLSGWEWKQYIQLPDCTDLLSFLRSNPNAMALLPAKKYNQMSDEFWTVSLPDTLLAFENAICWNRDYPFLAPFCHALAQWLKT